MSKRKWGRKQRHERLCPVCSHRVGYHGRTCSDVCARTLAEMVRIKKEYEDVRHT